MKKFKLIVKKTIFFFVVVAALCNIFVVHNAVAQASGIDNISNRADYLYNITWTPQKNISGWRGKYTYIQGNTYRIPYGQPVSSGKYICYGISVEEFINSTKSSNSVFYSTKSYNNYNSGSYSTYYAMDCSAFVSYCWGLSNRTTTGNWSKLSVTSYGKCNTSNVHKVQRGDALNLAGSHIVLVSDAYYDNNGNIMQFEITEQTPYQLKRTYHSPSSLVSKYGSYTIYRYNKRDSVPAAPTTYNNPIGCIDTCEGGAGTVTVKGWAFDKDNPSQSLQIHVYTGGGPGDSNAEGYPIDANIYREDVNSAYGITGNHGFSATIPTSKLGEQKVYIYACNIGTGENTLIGEETVIISGKNPIGRVESCVGDVGSIRIEGWALDADDTSQSLQIHVYIGGPAGSPKAEGYPITTNLCREDINSKYGVTGNHGFDCRIPTSKTGTQKVYVYACNIGTGENKFLGEHIVTISSDNPIGKVEAYSGEVASVHIKGFAFDNSDATQPLQIHIYVGGGPGSDTAQGHQTTTCLYRDDVNSEYGIEGEHGFDIVLPTHKEGEQKLYVYACNIGSGENVLLGDYTVNIKPDTILPEVTDIKITDITPDSYTVSCKVTDNLGISRVCFPTWTANNEQDDIIWYEAPVSDNVATLTIKRSAHNNEYGGYITHIYAWDLNENCTYIPLSWSHIYEHTTLSFDANGGITSTNSKPIMYMNPYGELPIPIREGYEFIGWFTSVSGGSHVTDETTVAAATDHTLYAQWKRLTPYIEADVTKSLNSYSINYEIYNINTTHKVIAAGYIKGQLVSLDINDSSNMNKSLLLDGNIDEVKVMVWDDIKTMLPLCEVKTIPIVNK